MQFDRYEEAINAALNACDAASFSDPQYKDQWGAAVLCLDEAQQYASEGRFMCADAFISFAVMWLRAIPSH